MAVSLAHAKIYCPATILIDESQWLLRNNNTHCIVIVIDLEETGDAAMTAHLKVAEPLPSRGGSIQLVRYSPSRDGWTHELIAGTYISATKTTLTIRRDGETMQLDRSHWAVCLEDAPVVEVAPEPSAPPTDLEQTSFETETDSTAQQCTAVRTRFTEDPAVVDVRVAEPHRTQRTGRRVCSRCGADVKVTQRLERGEPAASWFYERHAVPAAAAAVREAG
jgi:hypothetical protein